MFVPNSLHHLSNSIEMSYFACLGILQKVLQSYEPSMSYLFPLPYLLIPCLHPTSSTIHTGTHIVTRFILL